MIDQPKLIQLLNDWGYLFIEQAHGVPQQPLFRRLLESLHTIFRYVEPTTCEEGLIVFVSMDDIQPATLAALPTVCERAETLSQEVRSRCVVQVLEGGQFRVWKDVSGDVASALASSAFVYRYSNRTECFFGKDQQKSVPKVLPEYPSLFAMPTFHSLKQALENYKTRMVRQSTCKILDRTWHEKERIFFKNAQESVLRDSLTNHLKSTLRGDAEVRPEQNVDASHPVDIKVTWFGTNRLALIEIKWLGDSKESQSGKITNQYRDARAKEGAKQLAEYLDWNRQQVATHVTRGYLVLFDARRRGLMAATTRVSTENGLHYRDVEIDFDPKYHEIRDDFEVPARMFIEPVCTDTNSSKSHTTGGS